MTRTVWLLVYAACQAAKLLLTWLEEHAEKRVKGGDVEEPRG